MKLSIYLGVGAYGQEGKGSKDELHGTNAYLEEQVFDRYSWSKEYWDDRE